MQYWNTYDMFVTMFCPSHTGWEGVKNAEESRVHHLAERNLLCIMMLHCIYNGIVLGMFAFISIYYFLQALEQREKKDFQCIGVMYLLNSVFFIYVKGQTFATSTVPLALCSVVSDPLNSSCGCKGRVKINRRLLISFVSVRKHQQG